MNWAGSSAVRSFSASVRSFSSSLRSYPVGLRSFSTGCRSFFAGLPVRNFSCTIVFFLRVPAASSRTVRGTLRKSLQPFYGLPRSLPWASHGRTCNKLQDESAIGFSSCVMQLIMPPQCKVRPVVRNGRARLGMDYFWGRCYNRI